MENKVLNTWRLHMNEQEIQQDIQLESSKQGHKLWRNNSGGFKDETGRVVYFGLGVISKQSNAAFKSSDLIGFTMVEITKDMVGTKLPIFTAIEVKNSKWKYTETEREVAQKKFMDVIKMNKGIASFVNSVEGYVKTILNYKFTR